MVKCYVMGEQHVLALFVSLVPSGHLGQHYRAVSTFWRRNEIVLCECEGRIHNKIKC